MMLERKYLIYGEQAESVNFRNKAIAAPSIVHLVKHPPLEL